MIGGVKTKQTRTPRKAGLIGENVRRLRNKRNWTQDDLADAASVGRITVSRLEIGAAQSPRGKTMEKLAKALDVEPADLLKRAPDDSSSCERSESNSGHLSTAEPMISPGLARYLEQVGDDITPREKRLLGRIGLDFTVEGRPIDDTPEHWAKALAFIRSMPSRTDG